jgi:outer membrane lipoprotein-sorting protein
VEDRQDEPVDDLLERATGALRRAPVPQGPPAEAVAGIMKTIQTADVVPLPVQERVRKMNRIVKIAIAATVLVGLGVLASWNRIGGGSGNIAFAAVAEALDQLRSASFDINTETNWDAGKQHVTATGKGFFLAPSKQRTEISSKVAKSTSKMVMIFDQEAGKGLMLMSDQKFAMAMDIAKMKENAKKSAKGAAPDLFETVRRLVREGSSGAGEKAEKLGKKEIDGYAAVGFRTHNAMGDMTLWADAQTARPVRIELIGDMFEGVRMVMDHFRYNVALDPSLFSLEPPAGYSSQAVDFQPPVEADLLRTLRLLAEHGKGMFPAKLAMNKEVMDAVMAAVQPELNKITAKHIGKANPKAKPGEQPSSAMMADTMKTLMPLIQKQMGGVTFYMQLEPENDAHYAGGGVKLGTPDRPILWYRPSDAAKYRVVYADLSVKEMSAEEVKKLPGPR